MQEQSSMITLLILAVVITLITISAIYRHRYQENATREYIDEWYSRGPWYATLDPDGFIIVTNGKRNLTSVYGHRYAMRFDSEQSAKLRASQENHTHHSVTHARARAESLGGRPL